MYNVTVICTVMNKRLNTYFTIFNNVHVESDIQHYQPVRWYIKFNIVPIFQDLATLVFISYILENDKSVCTRFCTAFELGRSLTSITLSIHHLKKIICQIVLIFVNLCNNKQQKRHIEPSAGLTNFIIRLIFIYRLIISVLLRCNFEIY